MENKRLTNFGLFSGPTREGIADVYDAEGFCEHKDRVCIKIVSERSFA